MSDQSYRTIDIERRGYGRRYTWLPVDTLTREGCSIELLGAYMRPAMFDIQVNDTVRWREGEQLVEARVASVQRGEQSLQLEFAEAHLLPPDSFYP